MDRSIQFLHARPIQWCFIKQYSPCIISRFRIIRWRSLIRTTEGGGCQVEKTKYLCCFPYQSFLGRVKTRKTASGQRWTYYVNVPGSGLLADLLYTLQTSCGLQWNTKMTTGPTSSLVTLQVIFIQAVHFFSTPVLIHGGLLCIAFCLSVRLSVTGPKFNM